MRANRQPAVIRVPFAPNLVLRPLVLLVEDEPAYLDLRKKVMEKAGYNVVCVSGVEDALQTLREAPVCCVIADHMLKGETGGDAATLMKSIKPDVPVVLLSGLVPEHMNGVDVFIHKGESTEKFLSIIDDMVRRYCE